MGIYSKQGVKICRIFSDKTIPSKNKVRFEKGISSPEESYWLGFLVGDGIIYENRYRVRLSLQKKDRKHLEKFVKFLG